MFAQNSAFPRLLLIATLFSVTAPAVRAGETADRDKLAGKWQPAEGQKSDYGTWTLEANDTGVRVLKESNGQKVAEYECNTMGRECEVKEDGHSAKVSMWFNGPKLVQMMTRGSEVVKRRFHVTGDTNTLELEIIPIAPAGKTEVVRLIRCQPETQARQN
jgi:hypothetical protein